MKRFVRPAVSAAIVMIVAGYIYLTSNKPGLPTSDYVKVFTAARAYRSQLKAKGMPIPASVTVPELVQHGLLSASDAKGFAGDQVTISLTPGPIQPNEPLMRIRLPDGRELVALGDGSVQERKP